MQATIEREPIDRYARAVAASKRVRWSIDEDVIRNRTFDPRHKFLPDGLSRIEEFAFLSEGEQRYLSQIRGGLTQTSLAWSRDTSTRRCSRSVTTMSTGIRRHSKP
jgi:hypothetical protein